MIKISSVFLFLGASALQYAYSETQNTVDNLTDVAVVKPILSSKQSFKRLSTLVGEWQPESGNNDSGFKISFVLTANDTVLMEQWLYRDKVHSLTLYHLNNDKLMATHYCPQGNQPRLQAKASVYPNHVQFGFLDISNLSDSSQSHQQELGFEILDNGKRLRRTEVYVGANGKNPSTLILKRNAVVPAKL